MKVSSEKIEGSQVLLTVEVEPAMLEESLDKAYRRLANRIQIPGFRKGKVPRPVLERYIGKDALMEEALDKLVPEAYGKALEQESIDPVAPPQIEITQTDPVAFKATVPIRPTVKLGDYRQVRVSPETVEVKDEEIDEAIERIRKQQATWEPVDRPVRLEDLVTLDIESNVEGIPYINEKDWQYFGQPKSTYPAPGFAESLEGLEKSQEKQIQLGFPEDHINEGLAGKQVVFKVLVTEIKERVLPELKDEFAKGVGDGFETLQALRDRVAADLRAKAEKEAKERLEDRVITEVVGMAEVEYPQVLVDREIDHFIEDQIRGLRGVVTKLDDYLKLLRKTEEELRDEIRPHATDKVTRSLVLGKVSEEEKLEVTEDDTKAEVDSMAQGAGERAEQMRRLFGSEEAKSYLRNMLLTRKTVQRLVNIATGVEEKDELVAETAEDETAKTTDVSE